MAIWLAPEQVLEKGQSIGNANSLHRLSINMLAEQVSLHIESGFLNNAQQLCDEWGLLDRSWCHRFGSDNPVLINNLKRIEIEMALAHGDHDKAITLCRLLARQLWLSCRPRMLVRIGILKSAALHKSGKNQKAWRELSATIGIARPNELVSSFFELRHLCLPILREVIEHRVSSTEASATSTEPPEDWLLRKLKTGKETSEIDEKTGDAGDEWEMVDDLTPRELEMLKLAAKGCTNAEIASHLLVSVATVKWHLYNAFQKLGAHNRMTALARLRELGLLS